MEIGFIGIGQMGYPMAKNILSCGHRVHAYNRTPEKAERLREFGAIIEKSPMDVAENSEKIIIMVSNNEAVNEILFGERGIYHSKRKGLVMDMSTISPIFSIEVANRLKSSGFRYIDSPVIGSVPHA
ncbi:MAG: NAD(P)-dependent oxidoreductase, partial [Thermoplasmata archaeon]